MVFHRVFGLVLLSSFVAFSPTFGQEELKTLPREIKAKGYTAPDLKELLAKQRSEFSPVAHIYESDRSLLLRTYSVPLSTTRSDRLDRFYAGWIVALSNLNADKLSPEAKAELEKLRASATQLWREVVAQRRQDSETREIVPFSSLIIDLEEARKKMDPVDPVKAAGKLVALLNDISAAKKALETDLETNGKEKAKFSKQQVARAAQGVTNLQTALKGWFDFYNGYDPLFSWWMAVPYKEADLALAGHAKFLKDFAAKLPERTPPTISDEPPTSVPPQEMPDLAELLKTPVSEMAPVISRYQSERFGGGGGRFNRPGRGGPGRGEERLPLLQEWLAALDRLDFDSLSRTGQLDYLLLKHQIQMEAKRIGLQTKIREETASLVPFEKLTDALGSAGKVNAEKEIAQLNAAIKLMKETRELMPKVDRSSLNGALDRVNELRTKFREVTSKRKVDDPKLSAAEKETDGALQSYAAALREELAKTEVRDSSGINGRPIGRAALLLELEAEMIPYTPEELVQIAEREYAWCEAEMKKASKAMGFGDDWRKAVEKVKTLHVEPGQQPQLIRDLSDEAVNYLRKHDLVSLPPVCVEGWRMQMMTPERQLLSPFFTGGEVISVAFPTNTMSHDAKLQSLRGNNVHFSRATVHHELIPGHHLQGYMAARYQTQRRAFSTPFFIEGWALYWEFVFYSKNFPAKPEDKVGFLFWRMHRCARIVFSLNYHLGKMSPQACIDYLVNKVGHERENATAEVRRSFVGGYPPLYQAAYMLGGLELWGLRKEFVDSGKMTDRDFHDALLKESSLPILAIRAVITKQKLTKDGLPPWKFYGKDLGVGTKTP